MTTTTPITSTAESLTRPTDHHRRLPIVARRLVANWLAVWLLITTIFVVAAPMLAVLPLPLRTLALTAVMVPTMSLLIGPRLERRLHRWFTEPNHRLLGSDDGEAVAR